MTETVLHSALVDEDSHVLGFTGSSTPTDVTEGKGWYRDTDGRLYFAGASELPVFSTPARRGVYNPLLDQRDYTNLSERINAIPAYAVGTPDSTNHGDGTNGLIDNDVLTGLYTILCGGYSDANYPAVTATNGTMSGSVNGYTLTTAIRLATTTTHGFMAKADKAIITQHTAGTTEAEVHPALDSRITALEEATVSDAMTYAKKAYNTTPRCWRWYRKLNAAYTTKSQFVTGSAPVVEQFGHGLTILSTGNTTGINGECSGNLELNSSAGGRSYLALATFTVDDTLWDPEITTLSILVPVYKLYGNVYLNVIDHSDGDASITIYKTTNITADPIVWTATNHMNTSATGLNYGYKFNVTPGHSYEVQVILNNDGQLGISPWVAYKTDWSASWRFDELDEFYYMYSLRPRGIAE